MSYLDDLKEKEKEYPSKSGYELRTDVLGMAQGILGDKVSRLFDNECLRPEGQRQAGSPQEMRSHLFDDANHTCRCRAHGTNWPSTYR